MDFIGDLIFVTYLVITLTASLVFLFGNPFYEGKLSKFKDIQKVINKGGEVEVYIHGNNGKIDRFQWEEK